MKYSILLALIIIGYPARSQKNCDEISLGGFLTKLKNLKPIDEKELRYVKGRYFDFAKFAPSDSVSDLENVVVGYDKSGNINALVFEEQNNNQYTLLVYNFSAYRILILKNTWDHGRFNYTPTAIYNPKNGRSYMVNVKTQFSTPYDNNNLWLDEFPLKGFNDVSCIMSLDDHLYPEKMLKLSNGKIVMDSDFHYDPEDSHMLSYEMMHFYIDAEHYLKKQVVVSEQSCIMKIFEDAFELKASSNLVIRTQPKIFSMTKAPVWIFSGAHPYFKDP